MAVAQHLVGRVVVGPRVQPGRAGHRGDPPVGGRPPPGLDPSPVPLVVAHDRLLPGPAGRHRPVDAHLVQPQGGQGQHDLQRHVLAAPERPADGRIDHPDPVLVEAQGVGDLLPVLVGPLAGDLHRHPPPVVDVGQPGLGLQVGVLLVGQLEHRRHGHRRVGPAPGHVALADAVGVVAVGALAVVGVDQGVGGQGLVDVGQHRQRVPHRLDGRGRGPGLVGRLGHHQGQMVGLPAGHIAGHLAAAGVVGPHEHGLVEHGEAVLVDGNVGRPEHGDHPRRGPGRL